MCEFLTSSTADIRTQWQAVGPPWCLDAPPNSLMVMMSLMTMMIMSTRFHWKTNGLSLVF